MGTATAHIFSFYSTFICTRQFCVQWICWCMIFFSGRVDYDITLGFAMTLEVEHMTGTITWRYRKWWSVSRLLAIVWLVNKDKPNHGEKVAHKGYSRDIISPGSQYQWPWIFWMEGEWDSLPTEGRCTLWDLKQNTGFRVSSNTGATILFVNVSYIVSKLSWCGRTLLIACCVATMLWQDPLDSGWAL